jgi:hypothetical protein
MQKIQKTTEMSVKYDICYKVADTPNITLTTFEEYHRLQYTIAEYYCFQSLYLKAECTP